MKPLSDVLVFFFELLVQDGNYEHGPYGFITIDMIIRQEKPNYLCFT